MDDKSESDVSSVSVNNIKLLGSDWIFKRQNLRENPTSQLTDYHLLLISNDFAFFHIH